MYGWYTAELRCLRLRLPSLSPLLLHLQPASQRASFPRRIGRRWEIARQSPAGGVCGRTKNSTQTYLTDTQRCNTAAAVGRTLLHSALHSRRPACSFVCSYADVPVATGRSGVFSLL
jgi:hypothetical protein